MKVGRMKVYAAVYRSKKFERIMGSIYERESTAKAYADLCRFDAVSEPIIIEIPLKGVDL